MALLGFGLLSIPGEAQNQAGFMYGKVITQSNNYEGPLRWGAEEVCWTDYFNASKRAKGIKNCVPEPKKEETSWFDFDWDIHSIWKDKVVQVHQFNCQFGDIKELKVTGNSTARLRFKDGKELDVLGDGYNDLGGNIVVLDKELGLTTIDWDRVEKVEFMPSPKKHPVRFGEPIYGTVETLRKEKLTGFVQWDHDERFAADKLDGYTADGKIAIAFAEIVSIEKRGNGCGVVLQSGKDLNVTGTNDVNPGNRGVMVTVPGKGMVDVPWFSFRKVTFTQKDEAGPSYETFETPRPLTGKVSVFNEGELGGKLVYDLDESLDLETLEGSDNGLSYTIPFRNIRSIKPKNDSYSLIELKNGETLFLGGSNDVSTGNSGMAVFVKGKKEPVYVPWSKIDEVRFE